MMDASNQQSSKAQWMHNVDIHIGQLAHQLRTTNVQQPRRWNMMIRNYVSNKECLRDVLCYFEMIGEFNDWAD
jgi:hypothetical protein